MQGDNESLKIWAKLIRWLAVLQVGGLLMVQVIDPFLREPTTYDDPVASLDHGGRYLYVRDVSDPSAVLAALERARPRIEAIRHPDEPSESLVEGFGFAPVGAEIRIDVAEGDFDGMTEQVREVVKIIREEIRKSDPRASLHGTQG